MLLSIAFVVAVVLILLRLLKWAWATIKDYNQQMEVVKDIPCENRHWFFGHGRYFTANEKGLSRELDCMATFRKSYQKWFGPLKCIIMSYDPEITKTLLSVKDGKTGFIYNLFRSWIGDGLLISNGKKWLRNRRLLTPIFHFDALKRYLPCINDATMELMNKWKSRKIKALPVEMFQDISLTTLDGLLRCMLSKHSGCESGENKIYLDAVHCLTNEIARRVRNPFYRFDFIYFLSSHGRRYEKALKVVHAFTEKAIRVRSHEIKSAVDRRSSSEYDFLDVLLMAKDENGKGLTHKEIRDELDTFVFEGHDTVTSGISWALYNMALHQELQERCREEVVQVLNGGNRVEWEHLPKLQYLTKFIKESMRVNPPVLEIRKTLNQSVTFPTGFSPHHMTPGSRAASAAPNQMSKTFPKDTIMGLRIFLLHRNPSVWKDPDIFDPERFHPDNVAKRSPHAYVPFSAGPRNCIGQNFAMNEMKVVLAMALSMFKFTVDHNHPKPHMEPSVVLHSPTGIHLLVESL